MTPRILVIEDEAAQREILRYNLEAEGFTVMEAHSGDAAMLALREEVPDLVLLDWMLPGLSGIEICRRIKGDPALRDIPVLMLSARGEDTDKVRGLDIGADDYITKPYSVAELMARLRTQLRRVRPAAITRITHGDLALDAQEHRVWRGDNEVRLGPTEFRLLTVLIERPGRVFSRDQLMDTVWGRDVYVDVRTVDVHIGRLRKALMAFGGDDPIRTVRGAGYSLG